jgi:hypothetical protein
MWVRKDGLAVVQRRYSQLEGVARIMLLASV